MFWSSLQFLSERILILRWTERDMTKQKKKRCNGPHVKYELFLSDFDETWIFSTHFRKILKWQVSWKSVYWDPNCSMRTGGQMDNTKLVVAFCNSANAPKKAAPTPPPPSREPQFENNCTTLFRAAAQLTVCKWIWTDQRNSWRLGFGSSKYKALENVMHMFKLRVFESKSLPSELL